MASAALDATVASLIGLTGLEDPGGLSADVPNEGRLSTVEEVWAGVRIGAFTYAITGVGEEGHAPDGDSAHLGYTVREGEVSPMRFHARTLEEHGPLPKLVTVLARNGERCVGEVTRGLRLEGKCSEEWIESYPAIEIDCRLSPDVVLVVSGAHPSATWGSLDFGSRGISFRDVPVPDDIESVGVFRRGQLIAEVAGPAYTSTVEALAVDGETFALLPTGHHGHGIAVVAVERRPAGVAQIAHPATACGAF